MTQAFNLSQLANKVNTSGQLDVAIGATGTLPVANGGTGLTSPGTSGNILTSNGTAWTSAAAPAGGFSNMQVFTSSGTFTVPAGVTKAKVTVVGGGGNGGSSTSTSSNGGSMNAMFALGGTGSGGGDGNTVYVSSAYQDYNDATGANQSAPATAQTLTTLGDN